MVSMKRRIFSCNRQPGRSTSTPWLMSSVSKSNKHGRCLRERRLNNCGQSAKLKVSRSLPAQQEASSRHHRNEHLSSQNAKPLPIRRKSARRRLDAH